MSDATKELSYDVANIRLADKDGFAWVGRQEMPVLDLLEERFRRAAV